MRTLIALSVIVALVLLLAPLAYQQFVTTTANAAITNAAAAAIRQDTRQAGALPWLSFVMGLSFSLVLLLLEVIYLTYRQMQREEQAAQIALPAWNPAMLSYQEPPPVAVELLAVDEECYVR